MEKKYIAFHRGVSFAVAIVTIIAAFVVMGVVLGAGGSGVLPLGSAVVTLAAGLGFAFWADRRGPG